MPSTLRPFLGLDEAHCFRNVPRGTLVKQDVFSVLQEPFYIIIGFYLPLGLVLNSAIFLIKSVDILGSEHGLSWGKTANL